MAQLQRLAIAPFQFQSGKINLTSQQQHYLTHVLRLRDGNLFIAMDGIGQWWLAKLEGTQASILEQVPAVQTELPVSVTLAIALPKGNGFDEIVRQCTELGVACIAPVIGDRTLLTPSTNRLERWRRIAQEAAEQSERQVVPVILTPIPFRLSLATENGDKYICVTRGDRPHLLGCLRTSILSAELTTVTIATGPEGGWATSEIEDAIAAGFQPVSLGRRILRAVTAPVAALSVVAAAVEENAGRE